MSKLFSEYRNLEHAGGTIVFFFIHSIIMAGRQRFYLKYYLQFFHALQGIILVLAFICFDHPTGNLHSHANKIT